MKKILFLIISLLSFTGAFAQNAGGVEMADALYSSGKIYVVVATLTVIFVGLAFYLFSIDRRLKKVENQN